jgi:hypothetical protein
MGQLARRGDVVHDQVEQRVEVFPRAVELRIRPAGAARGIEMREIELVLVGVERGEEVEHLVERAVGLGIGLVDLVQHHDGTQAEGQRLLRDELGLRHRAFGGIDQQDDPVHHAQDPLHLAAEIGVAGGVDDVDAVPFHSTEVALARMVIPRSRSRSLLNPSRARPRPGFRGRRRIASGGCRRAWSCRGRHGR